MLDELQAKINIPPFQPLPLLSNGKAQTIAASYNLPNRCFLPHQTKHIIPLSDGDKIAVIENYAVHCSETARTILLIHGLGGCELSSYLLRATKLFVQMGLRVIRMNLRGCGIGAGLAQYPYHSGRSEDARAVLKWLVQKYPHSAVTQIGYSLGGNITLKMAGEDGNSPTGNLDSLIAVSAPLDLYATVQCITKRENQFFDQFFVKLLRQEVAKLAHYYPELTLPTLPKKMNLYEFDNYYTAPRSGFLNARDYYNHCSSGQFIDNISLPTLILFAKDDPLVDNQSYHLINKRNHIDILITEKGGHVGWLGATGKFGKFRWMDHTLLQWVKWISKIQ